MHSNLDDVFEMSKGDLLSAPMNTPVTPSGSYHAHRERQRRRILAAAQELFDVRGIDRVTMADIVSAAGIRASTLYEYFSNKDDIVWAIASEIFRGGLKTFKQNIDEAPNAVARITLLLEFMADQLATKQSEVRFLAQFDAIYAHDWPPERLLALEAQLNPEGFQYFSRLVREGIADGSLRPDLDPDLTMHAVINSVVGTQRRLASLGNKIEVEYGQPIDRLFREAIRVILLGLRAPDKPTSGRPAKKARAHKSVAKRRTR
jgi:AcrR family transcriptional regulator